MTLARREMKNEGRIFYYKLITLSSLLLYVCSVIIAWSHPVSNAISLSIYSDTPLLYWIFSLISVGLAIYSILYALKKSLRLLSWISFTLNIISFIALYIIRGYMSYQLEADHGAHLGIILNIIQYGNFTNGVIGFVHYPISHLLQGMFSIVTNINYTVASNIICIFFIILYIFGIILLIRKILTPNNYVIYILMSGMCLFVNSFLTGMPFFFGISLIPYILWLMFQILTESETLCYLIVSVVFVILEPMLHEALGLVSLACIGSVLIAIFIGNLLIIHRGCNITTLKQTQCMYIQNKNILPILILFVCSGSYVVFWISQHTLSLMVSVLSRFFNAQSTSHGITHTSSIQDVLFSMPLNDLLYFVTTANGYFMIGIFILAGIITFPILIKKTRDNFRLIFLLSVIIITITVFIMMGIFLLTNVSMSYDRLLPLLSIESIVVMGFIITSLSKKIGEKNITKMNKRLSVVFIILLVIFIPHLFAYNSTDINQTSPQFNTESQIDGFAFITKHIVPDYGIYGVPAYNIMSYIPQYLWGSSIIRTENNIEYVAQTVPAWKSAGISIDRVSPSTNFICDNKVLAFYSLSLYHQYMNDYSELEYVNLEENTNKVYQNPYYTLLQKGLY